VKSESGEVKDRRYDGTRENEQRGLCYETINVGLERGRFGEGPVINVIKVRASLVWSTQGEIIK
jgi:hypothetical protein